MGRPVKADGWKRVLEQHENGSQTTDVGFWQDLLADRPDVLHRLLADVYRMVHGVDRPPTLDDLWDVVAKPTFSNDPFPVAFHAVLGDRSVRQIALRAGLHKTQMMRYLNEESPIVSLHDTAGSMRRLEVVAQALALHPSYFSEWRRLWIMCLIDDAFVGRPELSVGLYRRFSGVANRSENGR